MTDKIKVLVVDDSAFVRNILCKLLDTDEIEVTGSAKNGLEGYQKAMELKPDVITMDIEMPQLTGIEAVKKIMGEHPIPIIMISSLTEDGALATFDALNAGAMDFITKSSSLTDLYKMKEEITSKVKSMASNSFLQNRIKRRVYLRKFNDGSGGPLTTRKEPATATATPAYAINHLLARDIKIIAIGISTGGPGALQQLITALKPGLPVSIVIAQHMPKQFTFTLAKRLNDMTQLTVKEAEDGDKLQRGHIYIAPGGLQTRVTPRGIIEISDKNPGNELYSPSVNILLDSVYNYAGPKSMNIIMTGMGNDGTKTLLKNKGRNGLVIVQSPETCVVAGMTKSIIDNGLADAILSLEDIPELINKVKIPVGLATY